MARLAPGRRVLLDDDGLARLRFPPPTSEVVIAVHPGALNAPENRLTLAAALDDDDTPVWVGAIDERMVLGALGGTASPRPSIARCLFQGARVWSVVWPGPLLGHGVPAPYGTIYDGDRPWVVLGELRAGPLLAAPLNDVRGNPKWYAPRIDAADFEGAAGKDGQLEMAHLWALPEDLPAVDRVRERAWTGLRAGVEGYYA